MTDITRRAMLRGIAATTAAGAAVAVPAAVAHALSQKAADHLAIIAGRTVDTRLSQLKLGRTAAVLMHDGKIDFLPIVGMRAPKLPGYNNPRLVWVPEPGPHEEFVFDVQAEVSAIGVVVDNQIS